MGQKVLIGFVRGYVVELMKGDGAAFAGSVRAFVETHRTDSHFSETAEGAELWIVPMVVYAEARALYAGHLGKQREAIRKAEGARELLQFLKYEK